MENKSKIVMIIPCWKRPEILSVVCKQLDFFYHETIDKIDLTVLYIFSNEDSDLDKLEEVYKNINHKADRIYSSNYYLGNKLNDGIEYASKFNYDYVMNMGSDDLIHPDIIDLYLPYIKYNIPFIGISSLYFYKKHEQVLFNHDYNNPYLVGAGRLIHISAVKNVIARFGTLYSTTLNRGLDTNSAKRLMECGYNPCSVYNGDFPYVIDIKSSININTIDKVIQSKNIVNAKFSFLAGYYPILRLYRDFNNDYIISFKYFSVVIPTMWYGTELISMLKKYETSVYVKEIIIIDNNPKDSIDLSMFKKVKIYTKGENIYVNPAWNLGASLAKYELILANDDIIIDNIDTVFNSLCNSDYDIVGVEIKECTQNESIIIDTINTFPANSYGCFMYIKNYVYIPEQFKIWYGDNFLFENNIKRGILRRLSIRTNKSTTVNKFRGTICKNDIEEYNYFSKSIDNKLNIIIRTSNRPIYFEKCIKSIKKHYPDAILHITIDDIKDLEYVSKCGMSYRYYIINRESVKNFCSKIIIKNTPFIYNYYFNIVKPFLYGWCMFLDDDDELVSKPVFDDNTNNIYLYKVDVGTEIVPNDTNFGKEPVLNNISGIGIIVHSSKIVDWSPQRGGDYIFIKQIYDKCNPIWINTILSKTQTLGNFGRRNDFVSRIAICIPFWKRYEITSFVFNHYRNLKEQLQHKIDLILIACGSEGDSSRDFAESHGFIYIEYDNNEFAQKHNALYLEAKKYNPDACLKIDSDSLISIEFFYYYDKLVKEGFDYSGILDLQCLLKDKICYWSGYDNHRIGETHGTGKFLSRNMLNKLGWRPWRESQDKYVDRILHNNQKDLVIKRTSTTCKEQNGYCIEIKSSEQLTSLTEFRFDKIEYIDMHNYKKIYNSLLDINPKLKENGILI